jgi:uncharacterized cupredoxin-like copper-binding protein
MTRRTVAVAIFVVLGALLLVPIATSKSTATTATTVNVTALDTLKFKLSKASAPAGKVTFKVKNGGSLSHDFKIAGKKTPLLSKGKTATLTVTLKKGKSYPYLCTVPGHAAAGMKGVFKAK